MVKCGTYGRMKNTGMLWNIYRIDKNWRNSELVMLIHQVRIMGIKIKNNNIVMILTNNGWNEWKDRPVPRYKLCQPYVKWFIWNICVTRSNIIYVPHQLKNHPVFSVKSRKISWLDGKGRVMFRLVPHMSWKNMLHQNNFW